MDEGGDTTARLLRLAGSRVDVPADRSSRVRSVVLDEFRAIARRRAVRRRVLAGGAVVTAAAALVLAARFASRDQGPPPVAPVVATVEKVDGEVRLLAAGEPSAVPLRPDDLVREGDGIETGELGRLGLRLASGASLRVDRGSRARLTSPTVVELADGALYVDTGRESARLEILTALGTVRNVGTQFEVRVGAAELRLRVRSGLVELRRGEEVASATPGTQLTVGAAGTARSTVAAYGPGWDWTAGLAPGFAIEGRPLSSFLDALSREHGWTLRYDDARLAREASGIILHGSVEGLEPADALEVVLATSGLAHRFQEGELVVLRAADAI